MTISSGIRRLSIILLVGGLPAAAMTMIPTSAFASTSTGDISGTVSGADGTAIPGATVTIEGASNIGKRVDTTDAAGHYHVVELPPGTYTVTFESTGYLATPIKGVVVNIDRTARLDVTMNTAENTAGIEVNVNENKPTIDVTQTSGGEVVNKDFATKLPVTQDYLAIASLVPGVNGNGNSNIMGSGSGENMFLVDGVNITDPVTNTFSANFNFESIDQVEVLTGGFDPEHQALGGILNVVTKSGGNDFHGGVTFDYHNDSFSPRRHGKCARYGLNLDGTAFVPTGNDLYDEQHCAEVVEFSEFGSSQEDKTVNAVLGGPVLRDKLWFFASFGHVESTRHTFLVPAPLDIQGNFFQGKLTFQPATRHKLTLSLETDPTTFRRIVQDQYTPISAEAEQDQGGVISSLDHLWFATDKFVLRNNLTYVNSYIDVRPFSHDLTTPGRIGVGGAMSSGNFAQYSFNRRERIQYSPKATYFLDNVGGNHEIAVGLDFAVIREDILSGVPGNVEYIDRKQTDFDQTSPTKNYYYVELSGPLRQKTNGLQTAFYVQDAWKPIERLTVRGGLRFDRGGLYNDQNSEVLSFNAVSPRLYAAYDLTGDGKTVVRGGYGRFIDPEKLEQSDFLNKHGLASKLYLGDYFGLGPNGATNLYSGTDGEASTLRAGRITVPREDTVRLGAERDVSHGIAVGLTLNYKHTSHLFEDDESNLIWNADGTQAVGNRIGVVDTRFRIRTPGSARRYYKDAEFTIRRRFADQFELLGSYTYSTSVGTTPTQYSESLDNAPQTPTNFGHLSNEIQNSLKMSASYDMAYNFTLGTTVNYQSGIRYDQRHQYNDYNDGYSNRVGARNSGGQLAGVPDLSVKLLWGPKLPGNLGKIRGDLTITNLTNNRQIVAYQQGPYDERGVKYPAARNAPLAARVGFRYEF